jgi:predicted CXXCH cytochrome family protein
MKRTIVTVVALALVLLSAGAALAAIAGSKHDMRTHMVSVTGGYDEVCVYCHTPHGGNPAAPLWNHSLSAPTGFTVYSAAVSSTMNATTGQPGAGSLLCLSCHDGTTAVDALANPPASGLATGGKAGSNVGLNKRITAGNALLGTNLSNDHPIGFSYQSAITNGDTGLNPVSQVTGSGIARLINGTQVECSSCHDAHNSVAVPFLRTSNAGSALCLACHIK